MPRLIDVFEKWQTSGIFQNLTSRHSVPWVTSIGSYLDMLYFGNFSGEKEISPLVEKLISANTHPTLTATQITNLATYIFTFYQTKWSKLGQVRMSEYNPIENYSMQETETPNITRTETPNITRTETPNITRTETPNITRTTDTATSTDVTVTGTAASDTSIFAFNSEDPEPTAEGASTSTNRTSGTADANTTSTTDVESGTRTTRESGTVNATEKGTRTQTETGTTNRTRSGNIGVTTTQQMLQSEIDLWQWSFFENVFKDVDAVLTASIYNINF